MLTCPNKSSAEWKTLEKAVGTYEAIRDYMETGGKIRTPEEVISKLNTISDIISKPINQFQADTQTIEEMFDNSKDTILNTDVVFELEQRFATEFITKLSMGLGVPYDMITEEEARQITKDSQNPWTHENAFFYNGKIYFIKGRLSIRSAFHEFAHPVVRALAQNNRVLFDNLYNQLSQTVEGRAIIEQVTKTYGLDPASDMFREEVIVQALTKVGIDLSGKIVAQGAFATVIDSILYNIKQFFRQIFGKRIGISKLNANTSLADLAEMLKGGVLQMDTQLLSTEDIVAYNKAEHAAITDMFSKMDNNVLKDTINNTFNLISSHLNLLSKNNNYAELSKLLVDRNQRGDFQAMRSNLKNWETNIKSLTDAVLLDAKDLHTRASALTNTIITLNDVMSKIAQHLKDISNPDDIAPGVAPQIDTQDNMHKAYYYNKMVEHWGQFIEQFEKTLHANEVPINSPIITVVGQIRRNLASAESTIRKMYALGGRDALFEQLAPMQESLRLQYKEIIENLEKNKASTERIDKVYTEYHGMTSAEYKEFEKLLEIKNPTTQEKIRLEDLLLKNRKGLSISKTKLEYLLEGKLGDANFFNSYLEGYLYNTDPIISGLALYIKNAMSEVMVRSQAKYNDFAMDMKDDLEAAGYSSRNIIGKLGQDTMFLDTIAVNVKDASGNNTGELQEYKVWTLLHKFKNYRYDKSVRERNVDRLYDEWQKTNKDSDHMAYVSANLAYQKYKRQFFHQEYVDEFYERQVLFEKDAIGIKAAGKRNDIFERMRVLSESNKTESAQIEISKEMDLLWHEYRQLHSLYNGAVLKTNEELQIAERLREYKEASKKFYTYKERKGVFDSAYMEYMEELRSRVKEDGTNWNETDIEWMRAEEEWIKLNTRVVIKQEFYKKRDEILNKIKDLLKIIPSVTQDELKQTKLYQELFDLTSSRDTDGQIRATELTPEVLKKIKSIEEDIKDLKTKINKVKYTGVTYKQKLLLRGLFDELLSMSEKEPTDYYIDTLNDWIATLDMDKVYKKYRLTAIDKSSVGLIYDPLLLGSWKKASPTFAEWFDNNHIRHENVDYATGDVTVTYTRTYAWNITRPTDPDMIESYTINDPLMSEERRTVKGLPSLKYYSRVVKPIYETRNIVGVTKDNQGKFLPKSRTLMSKVQGLEDESTRYQYQNERYEELSKAPAGSQDNKIFIVLEKLKRHHLANQESLPYGSRLYYDSPRYERSSLERIQSFNLESAGSQFQAYIRRLRDFFTGANKDSADRNYDSVTNVMRADMFDNEMTNIPISGLFDIEHGDVSTDITLSMMRYMASAERQKQLIKISPVVRAIQTTVSQTEEVKPFGEDRHVIGARNQLKKNTGYVRYIPKMENIRGKAINSLIAREFEGKSQAGFTKDLPWLTNLSNGLFKTASFSFFAMNIPSALKNSLGMKFQAIIEAAAGSYIDQTSLQKGNLFSYAAMSELSFTGELQTRGAKSYMQQLIEAFDMVQGRTEDKFGEAMSRSLIKDSAGISWLYSFRKWVEVQAGVQLGAGILYFNKVQRLMPDGSVTTIPYIEAFEMDGNHIRLKSGIDVSYALQPTFHTAVHGDTLATLAKKYNTTPEKITESLKGKHLAQVLNRNENIERDREDALSTVDEIDPTLNPTDAALATIKRQDKLDRINKQFDKLIEENRIKIDNNKYKFIRNRMHQVNNAMGGAYAKFDQPDAQRYLAFRWISFLRRYFTTMAVNRLGFAGSVRHMRPRFNAGLGDSTMGFYVEGVRVMKNLVMSMGKDYKFLSPREKANAMKLMTELVMLYATGMLISIVFGFDDKDPDRFEKLRAKSGALPLPGTVTDPNRPFDLLGYTELHALHLLMQVEAENYQFNPLIGGLKQYNNLLDIKSVALGPTTDNLMQILDDIEKLVMDDPKAYYTRQVGPYEWQQQESAKWMNHSAKTFGFSGGTVDAAMAIQNLTAAQARVKK